MKQIKPINKRSEKVLREKEVLFGLIEYFLETGKAVGSNTLKETDLDHLSAATIRNYFASLEEKGYLHQPHTSGGRIPTEKAIRLYAEEITDQEMVEEDLFSEIEEIRKEASREVQTLVRRSVEILSRISATAAFISAPRFDRDFIVDIKVVPIDKERILSVIITDFGSLQPEVLHIEHELTSHAAKRIENYLHHRVMGQENTEHLSSQEILIAQKIYNEIMVRFLVGYTNFSEEEIIRTGFSRMLQYPEFREAAVLAESMSLFENNTSLRHLAKDTIAHQSLRFWIGTDLAPFGAKTEKTSVLAIPYMINNQPVGALGLLGPLRLNYRKLFGILRALSHALSFCLTNNLYKFKLTYREPERFVPLIAEKKVARITHQPIKLIEHRK